MSAFVLHLRDQEVGGAVTSGRLYRIVGGVEQDWDDRLPDFTAATRGGRVLALLHGFNNSLTAGRTSLVRFADLLAARGTADVMLAVLWPGDGWAKSLTYPFEGRDADDAADALVGWLATHAERGTRVGLVGHSLGCRVAMRAARLIAQGTRLALDRVCLMAPAIDNDALGRAAPTGYHPATLGAERVAVLASREDRVLRYAFPLGDLAQTVLYREHWSGSLGRTGPIERDASVLAKLEPVPLADPARAVDHGDYLAVDAHAPDRTVAGSDAFVSDFFARRATLRWSAAAG